MALRLLPDAELIAVGILRASSDLDSLINNRVYTAIPAQATYPLIRVIRIGGLPTIRQHLDVARLQIEAWAGILDDPTIATTAKGAARQVAASAQAALHAAIGSHDAGVVTAVEDDLGLSWQPDPDTNRARYLFGVALHTHPNP